jgi:hypothetical protein
VPKVCEGGNSAAGVVATGIAYTRMAQVSNLHLAGAVSQKCAGFNGGSLLDVDQRAGMETDFRFDDTKIRHTFLMYALGGSAVGISKTQFLKRA